MDYVCERGAKRNFEPWRESKPELDETVEQTLDRMEREENEEAEQEERDKMMELEEKMQDSKREMAVADALDEIRTRNARIERGERGAGEELALQRAREEADQAKIQAEKEDEEAARRAFMTDGGEKVKRLVDGEADGTEDLEAKKEMPPPSFTRTKKKKKPFDAGLGIKKKTPLV